MVLWEITLGTAYFLGLKRTYRLALRIQRKLISPEHPRIHQFVQRRTRVVFDVALKVHRNIQERDIEVGRNLGNWIMRWLDRMKPSAQIRGSPLPGSTSNPGPSMSLTKQIKSYANKKSPGNFSALKNGESDMHMFCSRVMWSRPFPTIAMMMRPGNPVGSLNQHRHLSTSRLEFPMQQYVGGKWMMWQGNPVGSLNQHKHLSTSRLEFPLQQCIRGQWGGGGAIRKDLMQWMLQR